MDGSSEDEAAIEPNVHLPRTAPRPDRLENRIFDGYSYVISKKKSDDTIYLVCKKNSTGDCYGRGILQNGIFTPTGDHECGDPNALLQPLHDFRQALKKAMAESRTTARKVYDLISQKHEIAARHLPFIEVQRNMNNWRESNMPRVTRSRQFNSLEDFHDFLSSPEMLERLKYPGGQMTSCLIESGKGKSVALRDENFVDLFVDAKKLNVDCTFKVTPLQRKKRKTNAGEANQKVSGYQLLVVVAEVSGCNFPIMWIIMPEKSEAAYASVFKVVLKQFRCFKGVVMTDFEIALRNALHSTLPEAKVSGCLFHYAQALYKRARKLGILKAVKQNEDGVKLLRKFVALALLPCNLIQEGFEMIRDMASDQLKTIFKDFFSYYDDYWLKQRGPEDFCVYGEESRTNNVSESNNACLSRKMQKCPSGVTFATEIVEIQKKSYREFQTLKTTGKAISRRKTRYITKNSDLKRAWKDLDDGIIDIPCFLLRAASIVHKYPKVDAEDSNDESETPSSVTPREDFSDDNNDAPVCDILSEEDEADDCFHNSGEQTEYENCCVHSAEPVESTDCAVHPAELIESTDCAVHPAELIESTDSSRVQSGKSNTVTQHIVVKPGTKLASQTLLIQKTAQPILQWKFYTEPSLNKTLPESHLGTLIRDESYPMAEHSYASLSTSIDMELIDNINPVTMESANIALDNLKSPKKSSKPLLPTCIVTMNRTGHVMKISPNVTTSTAPTDSNVCESKTSLKRFLGNRMTDVDLNYSQVVASPNKKTKPGPVPKNSLQPRLPDQIVTLPIVPSPITRTPLFSI